VICDCRNLSGFLCNFYKDYLKALERMLDGEHGFMAVADGAMVYWTHNNGSLFLLLLDYWTESMSIAHTPCKQPKEPTDEELHKMWVDMAAELFKNDYSDGIPYAAEIVGIAAKYLCKGGE